MYMYILKQDISIDNNWNPSLVLQKMLALINDYK